MVPTYTDVRLLDLSGINISPEDFEALPASFLHRLEISREVLARLQGLWRPRAIVRWIGVEQVSRTEVLLFSLSTGKRTKPNCLAKQKTCSRTFSSNIM